MTPKQILDSFSETLMQDERILSGQERSLLAAVLRHAKAAAGENADAVRSVVASAVGETVAQRAFAILGGSIVEKIVATSDPTAEDSVRSGSNALRAQNSPKGPPKPSPDSPTTPNQPQTPGITPLDAPVVPPPSPGHPEGPGASLRPLEEPKRVREVAGTAVIERAVTLPARSVILDEFLSPQEVEEITRFTMEHESNFRVSEVVSPTAEQGIVNYEHRRSMVLMDLERYQSLILDRIKRVLPQVLTKLDMEEFAVSSAEVQITASNDGDFFRFHSDNGNPRVAGRHLTFVYFFHREPKQFEGGDLRIHDARLEGEEYVSEGSYQTIVPRQNQIVFFRCEMMHEITPVTCPSRLFGDSRFTINGWLRK
jgi:SM-20-related protein